MKLALPPGKGAGRVTIEPYPFQGDSIIVAEKAFEFIRPFLS